MLLDTPMSSTGLGNGTIMVSPDWTGVSAAKPEPRAAPPRKRRRIVISCTECHRRKQKCDRGFPCANCVSRNKDSACKYDTGAPTAKRHGKLATTSASTPSQQNANASATAKDTALPKAPSPPSAPADALAGIYFTNFNWQYGLLDRAWNAIGIANRDAQDLGLHSDAQDPKPAGDSAEAVLDNQWEIQRRRKTWMTGVGWDIYMACVLGRPPTVDLNIPQPPMPLDVALPTDPSFMSPAVPRMDSDPPTPLTRGIWAYHATRPLKEIIEMEKEGSNPGDFTRVDRVHNELLELEANIPAYFKMENPDTRFDDVPECYWLPLARVVGPQLLSFGRMALHRPYIFTRPRSRTEALKASLDMLHAQRLYFLQLKPQLYKTFCLFFGTFDAIVLMASIYILFPKEHPELLSSALQHFQWAVERFHAMAGRNSLAKSAIGVLGALSLRLKKSLSLSREVAQQLLASDPNCPPQWPINNNLCPLLWGYPCESTTPITTPTTTATFTSSPPSAQEQASARPPSPPHKTTSPPAHPQPSCLTIPSDPTPPTFDFNLDPNLFTTPSTTTATTTTIPDLADTTIHPTFDWKVTGGTYVKWVLGVEKKWHGGFVSGRVLD
ncbi:hypothetical protein N0V88_000056 [Collariella sp. IMI 366227]|nr:hypothetical protein N0V88_000056 [Collariella sp. IMI 366227]